MRFRIKLEWEHEDGHAAVADWSALSCEPSQSADDVGLRIADAHRLLSWLQQVVVDEQLRRHCEAIRPCPDCRRRRPLQDNRQRRLDTALGKVTVTAPRFCGCHACGDLRIVSPVSELLPDRVSPELLHLQGRLAAQFPYRKAGAILKELLPATGGLNHATTRARTLAVGKRMEQEIGEEIEHLRVAAEPAKRMTVGIDGAFVKAGVRRVGQRDQFEILTGRIETVERRGEAFAVVRDLDKQAKQKVQAIVCRCGRGPETETTILSDGEDGLSGLVRKELRASPGLRNLKASG